MTDEIEYRYVKGKGWVAGYRQVNPFAAVDFSEIEHRILHYVLRAQYNYHPGAIAYTDAI